MYSAPVRLASKYRSVIDITRRSVCRSHVWRAPEDGAKAAAVSDTSRPSGMPGNPAGFPYGYRGEMGPSHWYKLNDLWKVSRDGVRQSPVDLTEDLAYHDKSLADIVYRYCYDRAAKISNDGLLPMCHVTANTHTISGGPVFKQEYELVQYHFHFSTKGQPGSEHALNGKRYPAEVHFVHYKKQYGSFQAALLKEDGLAVIGAMLDITDHGDVTCTEFDSDIRKLRNVKQVGNFYFTDINLSKYNLATKDYFTYEGSLTSPPCFECVHWIILKEPIMISKEAFDCFTELQSAEGGLIANPGNFRPLQPLNGRCIKSCCNVAHLDAQKPRTRG